MCTQQAWWCTWLLIGLLPFRCRDDAVRSAARSFEQVEVFKSAQSSVWPGGCMQQVESEHVRQHLAPTLAWSAAGGIGYEWWMYEQQQVVQSGVCSAEVPSLSWSHACSCAKLGNDPTQTIKQATIMRTLAELRSCWYLPGNRIVCNISSSGVDFVLLPQKV